VTTAISNVFLGLLCGEPLCSNTPVGVAGSAYTGVSLNVGQDRKMLRGGFQRWVNACKLHVDGDVSFWMNSEKMRIHARQHGMRQRLIYTVGHFRYLRPDSWQTIAYSPTAVSAFPINNSPSHRISSSQPVNSVGDTNLHVWA